MKYKSIEDILYNLIETDDKGRKKVHYDLGKEIDKAVKRILNLKLKQMRDQ